MKSFKNLFLTIVIPISILFTILAIIYFSMSFDMNKAVKLGLIDGVIGGILFSILITAVLLVMRHIRATAYQKRQTKLQEHVAEEKEKIKHVQALEQTSSSADKKFMLLMDKELTFEVVLRAVMDQNIGEISNANKDEKCIIIHAANENLALSVTSLTQHTSEVLISAMPQSKNVQNIISYIKEKEYSFLDY